ncbi:MAG TPA: VOC family protein [Gaiellaceae bacterium]|jgi:lactoylglutathione lyase|nr:VOC family protein [Gaiellaceae bacterium]
MGSHDESAWAITGPRHAGITVSDLDRALAFYRDTLGLELLWRRVYDGPEIPEIVNVPDAESFDIAMLQVPGGEFQIELLEYRGCERRSGATSPADYGAGHVCFFVEEIDALYADLSAKGVSFRSPRGAVEMTSGPNRGGKSLYSLDPDGYIVEFHQRPPVSS